MAGSDSERSGAWKVATWNVNSLKARLPHVLRWLKETRPDLLALQETKTQDPDFPVDAFAQAGYRVAFAGQKAYNGVAVVSREPGTVIATDLPGPFDPQRRLLGLRFGAVTVVSAYVPNGASVDSDKYRYKLDWLARFQDYTRQLVAQGPTLLLGDFNIAPEDRDVHDPRAWEGQVLVSEPERRALRQILDLGMRDCFRLFEQPEGAYSWWDYRAGAFRRNQGLRIDLILADLRRAARCTACRIDTAPRRWERPSDHAPVIAEFDLSVP